MKPIKHLLFIILSLMFVLTSCSDHKTSLSGLEYAKFDTTINTKPVKLYTLKNASKTMEVCVTNYGARIVSVLVPNKFGSMTDVVLGFDNIHQYADTVNTPNNFGAAIGRYANRIAKAQFTLEGEKIQLPKNNNGHCLHGGPAGWHCQVFDVVEATDNSIKLSLTSPDGDMNFPGEVVATVTYTVTDDNVLDMLFEATTDKTTIVNMTNHSYFNLSGDPSVPCTDHVLYVNADYYTPIDSTFIPTGEIKNVYGTPMNFNKRHPLYQTIGDTSWQDIRFAGGYDHNWCLNSYKDGKGNDQILSASLYSPNSGIQMDLYTNEPGLQIYTGNFLDGKMQGKRGISYPKQASICLETQKFPDSPNKKDFPSPVLKPGEKYQSHAAYKFSVN